MCVRKGSNQNVLTGLLSRLLEVEPVAWQKADKEIMTLNIVANAEMRKKSLSVLNIKT